MKHIVIVGATSAIAEHCARLWVGEPVAMTLVGRSRARMALVTADLQVRSPASRFEVKEIDFTDAEAIAQGVAAIVQASGQVDLVLIAHGNLPEQSACERSLSVCREALEVNGLSVVLFAEAFAAVLARQGKGGLVLIGSVAGDRGRKSNYVYGAAKGLVECYAQGLQHRFAHSAVQITLVKPGPTDTPMTAHLKGSGMKLASVEEVANAIVRGVARGARVIYVPAKWRLIMLVIRHLPAFIFNRMNI